MNEEMKEMNLTDVTVNETESTAAAVSENELMEALLRAGAATKRKSEYAHGHAHCHRGAHNHAYAGGPHMGGHRPCGPRPCGPRALHAPAFGGYPYGPVMYGPMYRGYCGPRSGFGPGYQGYGYGAPVFAKPGFGAPCAPARPMGAPMGRPMGAPMNRPMGAPMGRPACGPDAKKHEHKGYGRILAKLNPGEAISQKELAERLGIRPQSVSEALYVLAERGLIERSVCETDRRVMLISLSEEGLAIREKMAAHRANRANRLFACLSEDEKAELFRLLNKIAAAQNAEAENA